MGRPKKSANTASQKTKPPAAPVQPTPPTPPTLTAPVALADDKLSSSPALPEPLPPAPLPTPVAVPVALNNWCCSGVAVAGVAHWRKGMPCQDAMSWRSVPRVVLALSDGAGSSVLSDRGAAVLVQGMPRFLASLEDALSTCLDHPAPVSLTDRAVWARRVLLHAQGLLADLARSEKRPIRDVRGTLMVVVVGTHHVFWWQVGDGVVVVRDSVQMRVLTQVGQAKGEFANQTCFVDEATLADVQCGIEPAADVLGLALMSDGGAERLVSNDGKQVAGRLAKWFDDLTTEQGLTPDRLALAYHEPEMYERTTLDDRSIVLAARKRWPLLSDPLQALLS